MDHYVKTDLGIQALKQRSFQLNARQRQLLLLIGTDDFKILNSGLKQRLATPELIQQLEELGLIFQNKVKQSNNIHTEAEIRIEPASPKQSQAELPQLSTTVVVERTIATTKKQRNNDDSVSAITVSEQLVENVQINTQPIAETVASIQPELVCISFDEIKQKMMNLLQTHCGLLAKQLIVKIQQSSSVREIKFCQMQWITALQESRISPIELNQTMQQINYSLQHLQTS